MRYCDRPTWRVRVLAGCLLLACACSNGLRVVLADGEPTRAQVAEWVRQLDSESAGERNRARQALEAAGPQILPWLPSDTDIPSRSVRDAVTLLRQHLERELARESVRASRVSWSGSAPWPDLLRQIESQTGNRFAPLPATTAADQTVPAATVIDVQWQGLPFWEAVQTLEQRTGWQVRWQPDAERFHWEQRPQESAHPPAPAAVSGPLRLLLTDLRSRPLAAGNAGDLLRCEARLQIEPRLRPLFAQVRMSDWTAADGPQTFPAWNPNADYELAFPDRTSEIPLSLDFVRAQPSDRNWSLQGKLQVHLAAGREEVTFSGPTLVRGQTQRRGGVTVVVRDARFQDLPQEGMSARIRIAVSYEQGGPAFESHRVGLFHRSAWLTDRQAQRIPAREFEIYAEADGGLMIEYRFSQLAGRPVDYQFTYEAPTLLLAIPAEFQFRNLPPIPSTP